MKTCFSKQCWHLIDLITVWSNRESKITDVKTNNLCKVTRN